MKKITVLLLISLFLLPTLFFLGCDDGTIADITGGDGTTAPPGAGSDPEASAAAVDDAIAALEEGNLDDALSDFTKAVLNDSTNGQALLGYALMEIISITVDPDVVSLARNNIGIAAYPSTMNELIEGTWIVLTEYQDSYGEWQEFYFPVITGEEEWADFSTDENNPTDVVMNEEKALAAVDFFVSHNLGGQGFNELVDGISSVLDVRITSALSVIDSIPSDTQIVFPGEATGILDNDENYQDLVVGKAEANILAAYLLAFRSQVRMGQVYDYSLPLSDYFDNIFLDILNGDEPDFTTLDTPFSGTFLEQREDGVAAARLADAKADMQSMISRLTGSLDTIKNRTGDTYSLSPDSTLGLGHDDEGSPMVLSDIWSDQIEIGINFADKLFTEIDDSLSAGGGTPAYIPMPFESEEEDPIAWMGGFVENDYENWPDETSLPDSVGVDFGAFYASPLMAINVIFDLDDDGEPVFYKWDGAGGFVLAEDIPALDENDYFYYVKINDISFNGTIDVSMIPQDDSATTFKIDGNDFSWFDSNEDGDYEASEISDTGVSSDVEGVVDITDWPVDEPAAIYWPVDVDFSDTVNFSDTVFSEAGLATDSDGDYDTLRIALEANEDQSVGMDGPVAVLDETAVYLALPREGNFVVWHSLTAVDDTITVGDDEFTSTGSFWWGLASMASMFEEVEVIEEPMLQ